MEQLHLNLTKTNELTEEVLAKANLCRNDPFSVKIKPEYSLDFTLSLILQSLRISDLTDTFW